MMAIFVRFAFLLSLFCILFSVSACGPRDVVANAKSGKTHDATSASGTPSQDIALMSVDFEQDIRPIINEKCVVCHGCYDAPCQLKMEANAGLLRGASQIPVYDASRLETISPTRLGIDADSESGWREKGFFDVLNSAEHPSLIQKMLDLGRNRPLESTAKITPDDLKLGPDRETTCAKPSEFDDYAKDHPLGGMPLAVSGLSDGEYKKMSAWLRGGAQVPQSPASLNAEDKAMVSTWERWLNRDSLEQKLVSRYLYEHLILGHLYLSSDKAIRQRLNKAQDQDAKFFRLVRSYTPPGKTIDIVDTVLPNNDPKAAFYYRLQPVEATLVYKNHIPYRFDRQRLQRYKDLFLTDNYEVKRLPGYDYKDRANPFLTFRAMPAPARYEFLLQDAEYFIRNFIRGPVCHGPIATDVIRDQFWTMFESPQTELYVNDANYRERVSPLLGLPGEKDELSDLGSQWETYSDKRNKYLSIRQQAYRERFSGGADFTSIWDGSGDNTNAFLTVFRHHNSASVTQGWRGDIPRTAWVLDYPLFERTYYELVVGFNVFGSVSHQLQTRLYFDLIRNGGEQNFLRYMPADRRQAIYDHWYQGAGKLKVLTSYHELDSKSPSAIAFESSDPKREFFDHFFQQYPQITQAEDRINRCGKGCLEAEGRLKSDVVASKTSRDNAKPKGDVAHGNAQALRQIASRSAESLPIVTFMPDVSLLAVKPVASARSGGEKAASSEDGKIRAYSIIRNRMHSNVAFLLGESLRYQEEQDTLSVLPEIVGSYPNLLISVEESELSAMVDMMLRVKSKKDFDKFIDAYGVRRMQTRFWDELHSFSEYLEAHTPIEAGIMDINRYGYW